MKLIAHSTSVFYLMTKLSRNFSKRRRFQFFLLLCLMIISAFAEVVSLGSVLPFLAMLTAPERVLHHSAFKNINKAFEITSADQLMLPLTILFIIAALIAGGIRILLLWSSSRLTSSSGSELSIEVYRRILYQSYYMHVTQNSSDVISNITNKVNGVVFGALLPLLTLVNSIFLLVAIILALILINPLVALIAMLVFGISYGITAWIARRRLRFNSQCIVQQQSKTIKVLQESLGGIRDVILDSTQILYSDIFRNADIPLRRATGDNNFIGQFPRYAMETIGIIMIAVLAYFLSLQPGGIDTALPILGAMGIGSQRLLPALQQIYSSWVSIVGNHTQLVDIIEILEKPLPKELSQPAPLIFNNDIKLSNIHFRYSNDSPWILAGIDLKINKGARIGFIGSTGTGKSTLLDVIMGLLLPTNGEILVDNQKLIDEKLRAWQRNIAHVPQNIFLADTTLSENIAFGIPSEHIDMNRVRYAAKLAQIDEYIESNIEGYNALVGERGIQLSGGQRQRIGIARALYKQADVLILDEATSALDTNTEHDVMAAIDGLNRNLTILIIAHRLTSLKDCDIIIELKHGKIIRKDSYDSIIDSSSILYE
jgi:ABC-type multidrug transport system fused ATPase/permease subunit